MKKLHAKGLGTSVKRAEPIRQEEEDALWENGVLGKGSPQALLDTMVYMCGMFFALRSGKEHRDLQFNQLKLNKKDGIKCLRYTENVSKTIPEVSSKESWNQKLWNTTKIWKTLTVVSLSYTSVI